MSRVRLQMRPFTQISGHVGANLRALWKIRRLQRRAVIFQIGMKTRMTAMEKRLWSLSQDIARTGPSSMSVTALSASPTFSRARSWAIVVIGCRALTKSLQQIKQCALLPLNPSCLFQLPVSRHINLCADLPTCPSMSALRPQLQPKTLKLCLTSKLLTNKNSKLKKTLMNNRSSLPCLMKTIA